MFFILHLESAEHAIITTQFIYLAVSSDTMQISLQLSNSSRQVLDSPFSIGTHQRFSKFIDSYNGEVQAKFQKCLLDSSKLNCYKYP